MTDTTTILALVAAGSSANGLWMWAVWMRASQSIRSAYKDGYLDGYGASVYHADEIASDERSRRTAKGNRTRAANRRALLEAKTAELKGMGK